ncbi:MAG: TRAP transporter large permease subunit [Candidatus Latescibacterota bacterium]|nr:TRAP transporter large permease subunit [Candidatus Latescibacterota bacterium]
MTFIITAILSAVGTPLFIVICGIALYQFYSVDIDLTVIFIEMYRLAEMPSLSALPLFCFSGFLLANSKAPNRIVSFTKVLFGWLPGGLAIVSIVICALFTALTGASGMTIVAMGGLLFPALLKDNYGQSFSLGLLTTSGSLGLLFPPSLPLILFGIISETPIDQLFIAGIIPGTLLMLALGLYGSIYVIRKGSSPPKPVQTNISNIWREFRSSLGEIFLPIFLFVAIWGGYIAISEAAALCVVYVFVLTTIIHREVKLSLFPKICVESMVLFGAIFVILASAVAYTNFLVDQEVPNQLLNFIREHINNKWMFLLALNIFLIVVGCMIDMFSALILVVPLILPVAQSYGIHPVHLGIIFMTNLEIGYSTPPVGLNLFISSIRFGRPIIELYRASLPFLGILFICLLIVTYVPAISLVFIAK